MLFGYLEEGDQWRANFPVVLLLGSTSRWLHPLIRWIKSRAFYILVPKGKRYQVLEVFSTGTRLDGDHCCFCCCNCCCGRFFLFLSLSLQSLVHCLVLLFHLISVWRSNWKEKRFTMGRLFVWLKENETWTLLSRSFVRSFPNHSLSGFNVLHLVRWALFFSYFALMQGVLSPFLSTLTCATIVKGQIGRLREHASDIWREGSI